MQLLWRPDPSALLTSTLELSTPSHPGGVLDEAPPPDGVVRLEETAPLGPGDAWERVADALLRWDVHRAAGLHRASDAPASTVGATVINLRWFGPLAVPAPCRVVRVIDEPDRRGFVYVALPGNPVQGEELFVAERTPHGAGRFRLRSHSRPAGLLPRALPPLTRALQQQANRRYAAAARELGRTVMTQKSWSTSPRAPS